MYPDSKEKSVVKEWRWENKAKQSPPIIRMMKTGSSKEIEVRIRCGPQNVIFQKAGAKYDNLEEEKVCNIRIFNHPNDLKCLSKLRPPNKNEWREITL